ncbi:hypothetical protein TTHERM_00992840 (macronuclear) [Tetrahymena thermophila SB210]|uniref:Uncharacterized protein n=1 Tax=Tetrahymena thermophila (strain SB210) TaxID=312017 RepID=Q22DB8_TETTS|nr:hypothetical protein TTHERM_00992840 [Tetrahymena thermophila SB210]EAR83284.3 hypothetical protein TTHERM_00992840 [Tetrahymena thermophila SB210]|eukprot:XP_001030947.3 hypothetical protein TTHERM_00992840 [Tetrahymena thermophila SB210]
MILSQVLELIPEESLNQIKTSILKILDEKIKNRYYINKHFQNAIMNYFLEDYGSFYLRDQFDKQSNREVRRYLTSLAGERGYKGTKYMIMMNIYFDVHKGFDLINEYRQLLKNVALQENSFDPESQEYISHAWKKAFGLFVLAHSFDRSLTSIFDIWNSLFLDQKIFRKRRPNSKTSYSNSQKAQNMQNQSQKSCLKQQDSSYDQDSSISQTNEKQEKQKLLVKQEFADSSLTTCNSTVKNSNMNKNNLKMINANNQPQQKSFCESTSIYTNNFETASDSISHTSNNLQDSKEVRFASNNQNISIYAFQPQIPLQQVIPPQPSQFLLQGQKIVTIPPVQIINQSNNNLFQGVVSPFGQQAIFINPQHIMINQQQMIALQHQQQQQLLQQQYQQQMMLVEQQKQFNLLLAQQLPKVVGTV